ncbi:MAG: YbjN domain-containing protein [Bordetella sp.]|nr:YbjN domain-containing protein [Bordetella sp.]
MNTWNREHRWSRAYGEDNGAAVLQMDVVAEGGIGKTNARYQFDAFLDMIEEFPKVVYGTPAPR